MSFPETPELKAKTRAKRRESYTPASLPSRVAYTPAEFASLFGRSGTWGYRQLYSGRVKAVRVSGSLMIPRTEVDKLLAQAAVYSGEPGRSGRRPLPRTSETGTCLSNAVAAHTVEDSSLTPTGRL